MHYRSPKTTEQFWRKGDEYMRLSKAFNSGFYVFIVMIVFLGSLVTPLMIVNNFYHDFDVYSISIYLMITIVFMFIGYIFVFYLMSISEPEQDKLEYKENLMRALNRRLKKSSYETIITTLHYSYKYSYIGKSIIFDKKSNLLSMFEPSIKNTLIRFIPLDENNIVLLDDFIKENESIYFVFILKDIDLKKHVKKYESSISYGLVYFDNDNLIKELYGFYSLLSNKKFGYFSKLLFRVFKKDNYVFLRYKTEIIINEIHKHI